MHDYKHPRENLEECVIIFALFLCDIHNCLGRNDLYDLQKHPTSMYNSGLHVFWATPFYGYYCRADAEYIRPMLTLREDMESLACVAI